MNRARPRGITLAELVVAIGIIGILSFLTPLLIRLFNSLAYLQQRSVMQKEVKAVLWQMSHEVSNAVKVVVNSPGCLDHNPSSPALAVENYNCMQIYLYDYEHYKNFNNNDDYEDPKMYAPILFGNTHNFVEVFYEVVHESAAGKDYNLNNRIDPQPYLLKSTVWDVPWAGLTATPETSMPPAVQRAGTVATTQERRETFLKGRVIRPATGGFNTSRAFQLYGSDQLIKVTLGLRSSYDKAGDSPRLFSAVMTMMGRAGW